MIWLTWRQHRRQALFAVIGLAVLAALMVPTGRQMHEAYDHSVADCLRTVDHAEFIRLDDADYQSCWSAVQRFRSRFSGLEPLAVLFVFLPLLVGLFFGAPLVAREVEHGTHRLVWTQGVTRLRWAAVKIALVGGGALALAVCYGALLTWWGAPLSRVSSRLVPLSFDLQGVAPVAYTLFAVALGVFAGTVWRKVLPAMAVTLVGYIGVRAAVTLLARSRYQSPEERRFPVASDAEPNRLSGDWIQSEDVYSASGRHISANSQVICGDAPSPSPSAASPAASAPGPCLETYGAGAYNLQVYQPAGRFWLFQAIETGIFLALAAVLLALAIHQVRRRVT